MILNGFARFLNDFNCRGSLDSYDFHMDLYGVSLVSQGF